MSAPNPGFNPESMERIYIGEPPSVDERERSIEDLLPDTEYRLAELAAEGLNKREIAETVSSDPDVISARLREVCRQVGIPSPTGLAAFFPLDGEDPRIEGKFLSQLAPKQLEIIQGFSAGKNQVAVARDVSLTVDDTATYLWSVPSRWPGIKGAMVITRVANAIRAGYTQELKSGGIDISKIMSGLALDKLIDYEPRIRKAIAVKNSK